MTRLNRASDPTATTTCGPVRGRWREQGGTRSAAFLGIPYAQPPVGPLRFAAPLRPAPWEGVRDATEFGATPLLRELEGTLIPEPAFPGTDTLNLNVFTPSPERGADLPVLVWIHGGGFTAGSPSSPWYDGASFNRDAVVTVAISYRLGFTGFGWVEGAPQNRGVLDWIAALEWVQENIANFGGDPRRVTIAGQSAGGGAVLTLLGLERAQPLFSGVLSISGALGDVPANRARDFAVKLAAKCAVSPDVHGFESVPADRLAQAEAELSAINSPLDALRLLREPMAVGPVVDGSLLARPTLDAIAAGIGADKPLLLGATSDEFTSATARYGRLLGWVPRRLLLKAAGLRGSRPQRYVEDNWAEAESGNGRLLGHLITDTIFRTLVLRVGLLRGKGPTWVYQFRFREPTSGLSGHCLDVPFWFDVLDGPRVERLTGPNPPQELADALHGCAATFIREGTPDWPAFLPGQVTAVFEAGEDGCIQFIEGGYDEVRALLD